MRLHRWAISAFDTDLVLFGESSNTSLFWGFGLSGNLEAHTVYTSGVGFPLIAQDQSLLLPCDEIFEKDPNGVFV